MPDQEGRVYRKTEMWEPPPWVDDAGKQAIARAMKTLRNVSWFEVKEHRGGLLVAPTISSLSSSHARNWLPARRAASLVVEHNRRQSEGERQLPDVQMTPMSEKSYVAGTWVLPPSGRVCIVVCGGFGVEKRPHKALHMPARKEVAALTTLGYSHLPSGYFPGGRCKWVIVLLTAMKHAVDH